MASKMEQAPARNKRQTPTHCELPGLVHGISSQLPGQWHPLPRRDPASPKRALLGFPRDGWSNAPTGHPREAEQQLPLSIQKPDLPFQDGSVCPEAWRAPVQAKTYSSDNPNHRSTNYDLFTPTPMADPQSLESYSTIQPRGRGGPVRCTGPAPHLPFPSAGPEHQASERPLSSHKRDQQGRDLKLQVLRRILFLAAEGELQLSALLSKGPESREDLKMVERLRKDLLDDYERVIVADVEFAEEQNTSELLWKNAFYQVIGRFGQLLRDPAGPGKAEPIRESLLHILEQGTDFFASLLEKLQKRHGFKLEDLPEGAALGNRPAQGPLQCALTCAQKTLICLGDLCRYREQTRGTQNFGRARSWYLKAQQLDPGDGHPYNQLALLAVSTKRKVDAVCYFMRGLAAPRASASSKENLRQLFEGTKRREEDKERLALSSGGSLGPVGDLQQSFTCSFLQAHARLFTGTGMETFPAVAHGVLHKFQLLLGKNPASIGKHQMLRLTTINLFAVHYRQKKERDAAEARRAGAQGEATALGLAMLNVLVRSCTSWLGQQRLPGAPGSSPRGEDPRPAPVLVSSFGSALRTLLPSVKVWLGWMLLSRPLWSPPPPSSWSPYPDVSQEMRVTLGHFWEALQMVNSSEVALYKEPGDALAPLVLEEDRLLAGFGPLLASPREACYVEQKSDRLVAADCRRVHVLRDWLEALGARTWHIEELKAKQVILAQQIAEEHQLQGKIKAVVEAQAPKRPMEEGKQPRFLVVDTNCFIHHLEHLRQLLERQKYIVVVPLIVVHELRGLSKGHRGEREARQSSRELQQRAQDSIVFLEQHFDLSNRHLRALSPCGKELASIAYEKKQFLSQRGNNDDHILSCCLKFRPVKISNKGRSRKKKKIPLPLREGDLVLFTDDRTLRVKALASHVPAWDREKFLQVMETLWRGHRRLHRRWCRPRGHSHLQLDQQHAGRDELDSHTWEG